MRCRISWFGLLTGLLLSWSMQAAEVLSDEARLSLLTCSPGEELYARYGHTAIRVFDPVNDIDITFNYGIFDFNTDHFYWKFVRGETWYELGASPTRWFMMEYNDEHRAVYEQVLNLTPEQREAIWRALVINYQPENRQYLYNFVFDNCATRPYLLIENALGEPIQSDYTGHTGVTYREFIRHYTGSLSWSNAGINLLFGPRADQPMSSEQRLFLPEELMNYMASAHLSDGTPLVGKSRTGVFKIKDTPWYLSWPMGLVLYFMLVCGFSLWDRRRQRWSWGLELAVGIPYLLLLIIVTFLTFFSCHPLVGFGWRLLIIPLTHLCARLIYIVR
ncbi:MAG: DUF4105 domain-containing protein [Paludibacteraceae bacterium]|nr:DUF4105 domain-containing protein [Paludibacteraceae bacterium]